MDNSILLTKLFIPSIRPRIVQRKRLVEALAEGWITGLQLAALSLKGRSDAGDVIKYFTVSSRSKAVIGARKLGFL